MRDLSSFKETALRLHSVSSVRAFPRRSAPGQEGQQALPLPHAVTLAGLIPTLLAALALRLFKALNTSIWLDEAVTIEAARGNLSEVWEKAFFLGHPPLHAYLFHFWIAIGGESELWLRLLTVISGVTTVYFTFRIAQALYRDEHIALIAATFVALSPFLVLVDREIRMYPFLVTFCTGSLACLLGALQSGRVLAWLGFAAFAAAAVYTQYVGALFIVGQLVVLLVVGGKRLRHFWPWLLVVGGLGGIALALLLPTLRLHLTNTFAVWSGSPVPLPSVLGVLSQQVDARAVPWPFSLLSAALVMLALLTAPFTVRACRPLAVGLDRGSLVLLANIAVTLGFAFLFSRVGRNLLDARYLAPTAPLVFILLAAAAMKLRRAELVVGAIGVVLVLFVLAHGRVLQQGWALEHLGDWRTLVAYLEEHAGPEDLIAVVVCYDALPLQYYYKGPAKVIALPRDHDLTKPGVCATFRGYPEWQDHQDEITREFGALARRYPRVWIVGREQDLVDPAHKTQQALLQRGFIRAEAQGFPGIPLELYINAASGF